METIYEYPFLLLSYKNLNFHFNTCILVSYIALQKSNRKESICKIVDT